MQVGDLVKYRYGQQEVGTIIEEFVYGDGPKFKVLWFGPEHFTDWMRPIGLEVINENR